jgi:hypothetical protein
MHWPTLRDELPIDESSTLRFLDRTIPDRQALARALPWDFDLYLRLNLKFVSHFRSGKRSNVLPTDRVVSVHSRG